MRILKKLLLFVVALLAILLIVGLFVKKDYAVEKEIVIHRSKDDVFKYLKMVKHQDNFSVWNKKDPNAKKEYKGTDGQVGFIASWDSSNKEVGKGEQEIIDIIENQRIDLKLRFKEPFEAEDNAYFITEEMGLYETRVKWGFKGHMDYPMNLMLLTFDMEKEVGEALQTGLNNLKILLEE